MINQLTNQQIREILEKELQNDVVKNVFQLANPHNFSVNPDTDNYVDMYNEIVFDVFALGLKHGLTLANEDHLEDSK